MLMLQKRERPLTAPAPPLEDVPEEAMAAARQLLMAEIGIVRAGMGHENVAPEEYVEAAAPPLERDFIYLPSRQAYDRAGTATNSDRLASIQVPCPPFNLKRFIPTIHMLCAWKLPAVPHIQGRLMSQLPLCAHQRQLGDG